MPLTPSTDQDYFIPFQSNWKAIKLPEQFTSPFSNTPHPIALLAVKELQTYIQSQQEWTHNFGLVPDQEGKIIGKMFGVLVVRTQQNEIGYLAGCSGKLAGTNIHSKFVPPIYDALEEGSFLNKGMDVLNQINARVKTLVAQNNDQNSSEILKLKKFRKIKSNELQNQLFDQYHFLNQSGEEKSLVDIFLQHANQKPPSAAGECAAPKLLQYAFQHQMQPIAIAEFWWGLSPKSDFWKHGQFYPACQEKCFPILGYMLGGEG